MSRHKLPAVLASLAMLAFAAGLFFPVLFQGKILAPLDITTTLLPPWGDATSGAKPHNQNPSDAVSQYLPYRMFAEKSLREDGYIGWNPYEMGGYSLAGNTMALPGSWPVQLHRWLSFKDAWNLGIIGEFLIAGFGMLVFLRSRNLPWLPCLIGAVALMFNAQFIIWIYHRWALGSFCWMPWVLWSYGNGFAAKPVQRRTLLLPVFLTLALLGGSLQHVAFIVLACGCLAAGTFDFRRPLGNISSVIGWSIAFILAIGIAAFSLIPQISGYFSNIATGQVRGGIGYESGLSQPFFHALLIPARIWPWLAGDPQSMDAFRLLKSNFMDLNYIGTIPMLLGFAGLFMPGLPRTAKWLIAVGILIPLTPLVGPLYHRVELLFILGAAWMTAEMLSCSINNHQSKIVNPSVIASAKSDRQSPPSSLASCALPSCISRNWRRLLISAVTAIGAALILGTCLPSGIRSKLENTVVSKALAKSEDSTFGADREWIATRAREWTTRFSLIHPRTAWVYALLVLGSSGLILSSSFENQKSKIKNQKSSISPSSFASLGGLAVQSSLNQQSTINNPQSSISHLPLPSRRSLGHLMILCASSLELTTLFHTWTTFSNPADLHPANAAIETVRSQAGPHRVLHSTHKGGFTTHFATPNLLAAQGILSVDAYESIQYRSILTATKGNPNDLRLTLAGVGLAVQPTDAPQPGTESWPAAGTLGAFTLRKNPAVPSPIIAGSGNVPTTPAAIFEKIPETSPVQPSFQTPNRTSFEVPPGKSWIRIAQNWHPGWQWKIPGGDWNPFLNGPDAACWIDSLPSGANHIDVQFFPRPKWLTCASIATAIVWLGLSCILLINRRRSVAQC